MTAAAAPESGAYQVFLEEKVNFDSSVGFRVELSEIHPALKPHQAAIVQWAIAGGRRAIFAAFGLGKTLMQLEILRLVCKHTGGSGLIVLPLGVRQEFTGDAQRILGVEARFIRSSSEVGESGIYLTNYDLFDGPPRHVWLRPMTVEYAMRTYNADPSIADVLAASDEHWEPCDADADGAKPFTVIDTAL